MSRASSKPSRTRISAEISQSWDNYLSLIAPSYVGILHLKVPRILPYLIGLIVLAFALGSLPRGTAGGSLLFRSYWLLYLVYLGPVVVLGAMAAAIIII